MNTLPVEDWSNLSDPEIAAKARGALNQAVAKGSWVTYDEFASHMSNRQERKVCATAS